MQNAASLTFAGKFVAIIAVLVMLDIVPVPVAAQAGENAICSFASGCTTSPSPAFIDAVGYGQGSDICDTIYGIFSNRNQNAPPYPANGAVIDARGISTNLICNQGSPWLESSGYINKPATILLPSGTIQISSTWVLPNGTKLIGQETANPALNSGGSAVQTTIQATTNLSSGFAMIQFGDSTHCPSSICTGISVEHLTLYGNGNSLIGIQNQNSQDLSYVDHVTLYHILGTGLLVSGSAQNSGPYTNINYACGWFRGFWIRVRRDQWTEQHAGDSWAELRFQSRFLRCDIARFVRQYA